MIKLGMLIVMPKVKEPNPHCAAGNATQAKVRKQK